MHFNKVKDPEKINSEEQLEEMLSRPTDELVEMVSDLEGDIMSLGVAGKIGPSLARMAKMARLVISSQRPFPYCSI